MPTPALARAMLALLAFPVVAPAVSAAPSPLLSAAQDANFLLPIGEIDMILREGELTVIGIEPSRGLPGERTFRATVQSGDHVLQIKYAPAVEGGDEFNYRPRYEMAAYVVQSLFLDEAELVVPPTVIRAFPLYVVQAALDMVPGSGTLPAEPTFSDWQMTLVELQYWLFNVDVPDELLVRDRIEEDEVYERLLGNFNLLTYIIRHSDSNAGNFVMSGHADFPRIFSVDNGVSFSSEESNRGIEWRELRLDRYPADAIEKLREVTLDDLHELLGVIVQMEIRDDGNFQGVKPTANMNPGRGIRRDDQRIQLGLTKSEIESIHRRIRRLVEWVDEGRYELIP